MPAAARASSRNSPTNRSRWTSRTPIRLNAAGIGIQVFIGGEHETRSVHNMTKLVDVGMRYGIPVMAVTAVGKELVRNAQYFRLACRMRRRARRARREDLLRRRRVRNRHRVLPRADRDGRRQEAAGARRPHDGLQRRAARRAGVDMGRNIFQSDAPKAMMTAVNKVVHENMKPAEARQLFDSLKADSK